MGMRFQLSMPRNYRGWMFGVALAALCMLPVAVREAAVTWYEYVIAKQQWADARAQAGTLSKLRKSLGVFKQYEADVHNLILQAKESHFTPLDWEKRQVDVRQRELTRQEVAGFLAGAGRGPGYFFTPEQFDLHIVQKGDDLFHYRTGDADRLRMTLKGVYLARGKN